MMKQPSHWVDKMSCTSYVGYFDNSLFDRRIIKFDEKAGWIHQVNNIISDFGSS